MKLLFIGNLDSTHFQKWVSYFYNSGHEIRAASSYIEARQYPHPDIVHAHYAGRYGLHGACLNWHPFVLTLWGSDFLVNRHHWWKKYLLNYQLKKADLITADTHRILEQLKPYPYGCRTELVQFGVDATKFKPNETGEYHRPIVVTINRQVANIELFWEVRKHFPDVRFVVLGNYSQEDLPDYLNSAWIYVDIGTSDAGLAMSIAEAMACGKPVLVPDHCDNAEWVTEDQLYIPGDMPSLVQGLRFYLRSENLRGVAGSRNRHLMIAHYNYNDEMKRMEKLYENLIQEYKSR